MRFEMMELRLYW